MERLEAIKAVQRMQDYIEEHLNSSITLRDLARAAGYSQWHSSRIFKELTGKTPFEYIRELRLSRAALELRDGHKKVADVAFDFVFDSHEGFTRAFSRQFGVSPKKFSKGKGPVQAFIPERIRDYYTKLQKGEIDMSKEKRANTVFVQVVERPARKLIIKRGVKATHYFEYCEEVGCEVWDILTGIKEAMYEPAGMWLPEKLIKPGTSAYVQGVEVPVDYSGEIPEGFEIIDLEPCKMMVFQGEPYDDERFEEAIEELWETMKDYNPKIYGYEWADDEAPRFQLEPQGYRGYIEARPVRQISR
ncbi:MAG: helix-turn-helix-domain containing protein, AraC type [Firmicutes bacterium]|nr:helix-turn-helix-domain containing protein, AraC type [Bacillota bacterium]